VTRSAPQLRLLLSAAALALVVAARPAPALAEPPVIESHVGPRPVDADALLGPVAAELAASGFDGARATARQVEARLSTPGLSATDAELDDAIRRIDAGYKRVTAGDFESAIGELDAGLGVLRRATASVAGNDRRRDAVMRALIGLALSNKRLGRQEAAGAAMAELIRSFPDREISYRDYGPEPRNLYNAVLPALRGDDGLGSLTVEVDDPETVVFLNERYVGVGTVTVGELYAGTYRVYVQQGSRRGRVHPVKVEGGGPTTLSVSWRFDAALHTEQGVASLVFDDGAAQHGDEARLAVRIGRALDATSVAVIGFRDAGGQRQVVGQVYYVDTRKEARSASVSLDPVRPNRERLRALGRYLAGDESARALVHPLEVDAAGPMASSSGDGGGGWRFGGWKWATATVGIAALATGVTLIVIDEPELLPDGKRNTAVRNTRPAGIGVAAAGAALTGLALYMFVHDHRAGDEPRERELTVAPTTGGALVGVAGRF
jgi:hypothetical protein